METHINNKVNELFEKYSNFIYIEEHPNKYMLDEEDFKEACKELVNYIKDL